MVYFTCFSLLDWKICSGRLVCPTFFEDGAPKTATVYTATNFPPGFATWRLCVKFREETSEFRHGCRPSETKASRRSFEISAGRPGRRGFQKSCPSAGECPILGERAERESLQRRTGVAPVSKLKNSRLSGPGRVVLLTGFADLLKDGDRRDACPTVRLKPLFPFEIPNRSGPWKKRMTPATNNRVSSSAPACRGNSCHTRCRPSSTAW